MNTLAAFFAAREGILLASLLALSGCSAQLQTIDYSRDRAVSLPRGEKIVIGYDRSVKISDNDVMLAASILRVSCKMNINWRCMDGEITRIFISSNDPDKCVAVVSAYKISVSDPTDTRHIANFVYCTVAGIISFREDVLENRY